MAEKQYSKGKTVVIGLDGSENSLYAVDCKYV